MVSGGLAVCIDDVSVSCRVPLPAIVDGGAPACPVSLIHPSMVFLHTMHPSPHPPVSALYNTFPETGSLPTSYPSLGFEATSTYAIGQRVTLWQAGVAKKLSVVFTSWACESGGWTTNCITNPGSTFSHPITLRFYQDNGTTAGALIYSQTHNFDIPYRCEAAGRAVPAASSVKTKDTKQALEGQRVAVGV